MRKESRPMKILFVSSECAPFSKSGGLADVAFSLPPALQKTGDDMAIVTPMYRVTQENCGDQFELVKACSVTLGQRSLACTLYDIRSAIVFGTMTSCPHCIQRYISAL